MKTANENAEPTGARWGFTKATTEKERKEVIEAVKEMSRLAPTLTWIIYDETEGKETTYRGGVRA